MHSPDTSAAEAAAASWLRSTPAFSIDGRPQPARAACLSAPNRLRHTAPTLSMSDMVAAGTTSLLDAARHPANRSCAAFTPPLRLLRNGAWPRWRAEETLRNGAQQANPRFLNGRDLL